MEMVMFTPNENADVGRFWPSFAVMMTLTPFFLLVGYSSAGAGHGSYFFAKVLFPFTILSTIAFHMITVPFLIVGLVQFPIYGIFLGIMNRMELGWPAIVALATFHLGAIAACFILVGERFS
jgi:hypothetical protein